MLQWRCSQCNRVLLEYEGTLIARKRCERCNTWNQRDTVHDFVNSGEAAPAALFAESVPHAARRHVAA